VRTWQASKLVVCRALNRSLDAETEIARLVAVARWRLPRCRGSGGEQPPNLRLRPWTANPHRGQPLDRLEDTDSLRALRPAVQGRMPKAGMPDLFLEIMQRTGFAKAFTHLSERQAR